MGYIWDTNGIPNVLMGNIWDTFLLKIILSLSGIQIWLSCILSGNPKWKDPAKKYVMLATSHIIFPPNILPCQTYVLKAENFYNGTGLGESIRISVITNGVLISYIAEKILDKKNNWNTKFRKNGLLYV